MSRWWLVGVVLIVLGRGLDRPQACLDHTSAHAPGVVLVGLRDGVLSGEWSTELEVMAAIPAIGVWALRTPIGQECVTLEKLRHAPDVAFAELDYVIRAVDAVTLNDPDWPKQWGPAKINAPVAWSISTGTPDVVIAVLDSGVRLDHPDLKDNLWTNPRETPDNGIDDDGNGKVDDFWGWRFNHVWDGHSFVPLEDHRVEDDFGHGTHVAGIAGAAINNGVGVAGMAGRGRLMTVKVLDLDGDGWYSDVAQGIVYAVDNGARVINLSLGGGPSSETLQAAIDYAHARGVLVVAATGNDGGTVLFPAAGEHTLAVAATNQNDDRPGFSSHGPEVDVAAPGVDIYSTWWKLDGYFAKSGTSMAAPHVAGLAALIWSARPDLEPDQVTRIITTTAKDVNAVSYPGWDTYLGWGRIEAGRALSATIWTGNLPLAASRTLLPVGEATVVTATIPLTTGTAGTVVFSAEGGIVSPEVAALVGTVVTTTLTAGPMAGMAVVTGTSGTLTGVLLLRLLPGLPVSTTLTSALSVVSPGSAVSVTLMAADGFGNLPLNGTPVNWSASGGALAPIKSSFKAGMARTLFTADLVYGSAVITASLGPELSTSIAMAVVPLHSLYLPVILRSDGY